MATRQVNDKIFNDSLKDLAKQFGDGYNQRGLLVTNSKAIPTGHDDLDDILTKGSRGIFQGGIIEICGSEASGKSSLALRTVGNAQKLGHRCCWFDAEASFTEDLAILNGCDPTSLVLPDLADTKATEGDDKVEQLSFLNSAEVLDMIYQTVVRNVFGLIVLDSVAGLMPQRVLDSDFDPNSSGYAELARNMATQLPKIVQACKKTETSVIFINQLRDQPGVYFQDRFHTPGGRALKFFAHQRISVEKIKSKEGLVQSTGDDGKIEVIGHYARTTIIKNRKAPPVLSGTFIEIPIYYKNYFPDDAKKAYDSARKLKVVTLRNNMLSWKEDNNVVVQEEGESNFLSKIRENKLESKLSASCVEASKDEKNISKEVPVVVPSSVIELAKQFNSVQKITKIEKVETQKKKGRVPALNLDEN